MDGRTHHLVGSISGGAYVGFTIPRDDPQYFLKILAAGFGGYVGSKLPDILEPATSSYHRDIAHSWLVGIGGVTAVPGLLNEFETFCSRKIAEHQRLLAFEFNPESRNRHIVTIGFWTILPSFVRGMFMGYLSHLALDATTPRGLPLIGK